MEHAAKLLQQTQTWSVQSAKKVGHGRCSKGPSAMFGNVRQWLVSSLETVDFPLAMCILVLAFEMIVHHSQLKQFCTSCSFVSRKNEQYLL